MGGISFNSFSANSENGSEVKIIVIDTRKRAMKRNVTEPANAGPMPAAQDQLVLNDSQHKVRSEDKPHLNVVGSASHDIKLPYSHFKKSHERQAAQSSQQPNSLQPAFGSAQMRNKFS